MIEHPLTNGLGESESPIANLLGEREQDFADNTFCTKPSDADAIHPIVNECERLDSLLCQIVIVSR
jgi:hypothetical protein